MAKIKKKNKNNNIIPLLRFSSNFKNTHSLIWSLSLTRFPLYKLQVVADFFGVYETKEVCVLALCCCLVQPAIVAAGRKSTLDNTGIIAYCFENAQ